MFVVFKGKTRQFSLKDWLFNLLFQLFFPIVTKRKYDHFVSKLDNCRETQLSVLKRILAENRNTNYGKAHNFANITSYEQYKSLVPIADYEAHRSYIEAQMNGKEASITAKPAIAYATTSGSTGKPKFIPITRDSVENYQKKFANIFAYSVFKDVPKAYKNKILAITSPAIEGYTQDRTPFGSTTGQMLRDLSPIVKNKYLLPEKLSEVSDYHTRYYLIVLLSLCDKVSSIVCANPSSILVLLQTAQQSRKELIRDISRGFIDKDVDEDLKKVINRKLKKQTHKKTNIIRRLSAVKIGSKDIWPDLELLACWTGGNCQTYLESLKSSFPNIPIKDPGYLASEIRGSVSLDINTSAGALAITDVFFEFQQADKPNSDYLLADELEVGERYQIFFTTSYGLYRYKIDDIIQVKSFRANTPEIVFLQKADGTTSITGEKLTETQLLEAVKETEEDFGIKLDFFICLANTSRTRYEFYYEAKNIDKYALTQRLEAKLQKINCEYACKRKSLRLAPLESIELKAGGFSRFKDFRINQGVREGQFKMSYLISKESWIKAIHL